MSSRFALVAALLLGGCSHMPVTSMLALSRIDFSRTDPAQLRAAVKLPRMLHPRAVAMRLTVKLKNGQEDSLDVALKEVTDTRELLGLHDELDRGTQIYAYQVDPADLPRVGAFREEMITRQKGRTGGSLSIALRPSACRTGELPSGALPFTSYLRTGETGRYIPLARDVDLRSLAPAAEALAMVPPCA